MIKRKKKMNKMIIDKPLKASEIIKMLNKRLKDTERIEMLWEYIVSLEFNGEVTMDRHEEGYEIQFSWKDWSK